MLKRLIFAGALTACLSPGLVSCAQTTEMAEASAPLSSESPPAGAPSQITEVVSPDEAVAPPASHPAPTVSYACPSTATQGGLIVCVLPAGAHVYSNSVRVADADELGRVTIGLKRDEESALEISWETPDKASQGAFNVEIAPRQDEFRELSGLECDKVDARTPEQLAHAGRSWTKKVNAFARTEAPVAPTISFRQPADGPFSSPFGPTRHYTGVSAETGKTCEKTSVHRGLDIATPVGTPLHAPMGGTVTLADPDLYYEGGTIFLDHGLGLVSVFMHLSRVDVAVGDVVRQGDLLGATGNTGRTTGPHLHWAVKWRNLAVDDRGGDFYIDPQLLLDLP